MYALIKQFEKMGDAKRACTNINLNNRRIVKTKILKLDGHQYYTIPGYVIMFDSCKFLRENGAIE